MSSSSNSSSARPSPSAKTSTRWMSLADPIHGIIQFDRHDPTHQLLLAVINSPSFQRLRRIKQMGLAEFVFPNATHSRFVHSLGATHLMLEAINVFSRERDSRAILKSYYPGTKIPLKRLLVLGILTHDIGHAPLSHTLEDILDLKRLGISHDDYWNVKIFMEAPDLKLVWKRFGQDLPETLLRFLGHHPDGTKPHYLASLISSQLDMDRLDYLLRDSHFLGVRYGYIESQRIVSTLQLTIRDDGSPDGKPVVAIRKEALPAVEHYLFGRHEAYKMALHPLDKAAETTLQKALLRFRHVRNAEGNTGYPADELYKFLSDPASLTTDEYLRLDDYTIWEALKQWSVHSGDDLLKALAKRLMEHALFKFVDLRSYGLSGQLEDHPPVYEALQAHYQQRGLSWEFGYAEFTVVPRPLYRQGPKDEPIWIKTGEGDVVDLKDVSTLPLRPPAPAWSEEACERHGERHLIFVWDSDARRALRSALKNYL